MARPISLTSAGTLNSRWSVWGLRLRVSYPPRNKGGGPSSGSSSRLISVWKESCRGNLSSTLHRLMHRGRGVGSSANLKRQLVAECHAAGAGSAGIAAMRGNMSE